MQIRLGSRYRLLVEVMRVRPRLEYTPVLIDQGHLAKLPKVPYFVYQRDINYSNDYKNIKLVIDKLKSENLYHENLLFAGFRGINLYKHGSYGKRGQTYAVDEKAFLKSESGKRRNRQYINSPFTHMDVMGKSMPALGVFDASKLEGGIDFNRPGKTRKHEKITWWTADGSSLDTAAVAVFFFKQYDSFEELTKDPDV